MTTQSYVNAKDDFRSARQKALMQQVAANISGRHMDLLDYEAIRTQLRAGNQSDRGLQEIPVDAIVGSVGRSREFTRTFLPKKDSTMERWVRVKAHVDEAGMDPISVYKMGEAYFVLDGNHRVSIARQNKVKTIPAYVTEVQTRVPLSQNDQPKELICKARYSDFLAESGLDKLRPDVSLRMTQCGYYTLLLEHIAVHRYFMGLDQQRDISYDEAAADWVDHVYLPIVNLIHANGLHESFPNLTDTDLYVLAALNRSEIEDDLGWQIDSVNAVSTLPERKGRGSERPIQRLTEQVYQSIVPDSLAPGPHAGTWRRERLQQRNQATLFSDILVTGRGGPADANMLDHALLIAQQERSRILGLRVLSGPDAPERAEAAAVQQTFAERCTNSGVAYTAIIEEGAIAQRVIQRSIHADLIALSLNRQGDLPTQTGVGTAFNTILQGSPRPVLIVPESAHSPMDNILLAYDGSAKADEALYLAAYMANAWESVRLSVLVVGHSREMRQAVAQAEGYLKQQKVYAPILNPAGNAVEQILAAIIELDANLLLIGSFGHRPLLQLLIGSTLNTLLTRIEEPVLVCR